MVAFTEACPACLHTWASHAKANLWEPREEGCRAYQHLLTHRTVSRSENPCGCPAWPSVDVILQARVEMADRLALAVDREMVG